MPPSDQSPSSQPMDDLTLEFFLEDLEDFSHITLCPPGSLGMFIAWFKDELATVNNNEVVFKLVA